jgi:hypothetical protein
MSDTLCEGCGQHSFLIPLHGPKGGPLRCPLCVGAWNAQHGRKRRTGRIVIRAIMAFYEAGGSSADIDKLKQTAACADFGLDLGGLGISIDPLGYMANTAQIDGADVELTSELLADVLRLTHPDHHPSERRQLAHDVTQRLLALQPFVFPAPKPKKAPDRAPKDKSWQPSKPSRAESKPAEARYPCPDCASTVPYFYCDACRAEYEKREHEEHERRKAKQREWYRHRPKIWTPPRPPKGTPRPRTPRQSTVRLIKSNHTNLINHGLSGLQAAILVTALTKRVPGARGCDVSYPELLAEIWGWKTRRKLRWTEEDIRNRNLFRAGDTRSSCDTHGAFSHIPRHVRRAARASLSRALTRLEKRMLISFVHGTGCYSGGPVLTPHGEQIARSLKAAERAVLGGEAAEKPKAPIASGDGGGTLH